MKPQICIDRHLPQNLRLPFRIETAGTLTARAVAPVGKQWINGTTLRVRFLGGTQEQIMHVMRVTQEWENWANIRFEFNAAPDAEIRISFDTGDGSWSYIGTDAKFIPRNQATMNFGWLDDAVILHEFGHALGLGHEHQNPQGGIEWDERAVIRDLSGSPNFWDEETIRHNVLKKYSLDQIRGTSFDRDSIMLYHFPTSWTRNGISTPWNKKLSASDQYFMAHMMYPVVQVKPADAKRLSIDAWFRTKAEIGDAGEEDLYDFIAPHTGRYTINTAGTTDTSVRLYGPNNQTFLIAEDDNSGIRNNAQIIRDLMPGRYWIQVRHSNRATGVGSYTIKVKLQHSA